MEEKNKLYFDYASTTPIKENVMEAYVNASRMFYNPSALNFMSIEVKNKIEEARENILSILNAKPKSKLIFTSCATESNNSALRAFIRRKDKKYIISMGEHSSIYNTAKAMINEGYQIDFAPLNEDGRVNEKILFSMIDEKTTFVSLIHVNNETGAINDIENITRELKRLNPKIIVHVDGVQALGKIDVDLSKLGVDLYTFSGHKIGCVRGIAGLYIASNLNYTPYILGGGQEMGLRSGTENVAGILALEEAIKSLKITDLSGIKTAFIKNLTVPYKLISNDSCVPNIISIAFYGTRGETIMHMLDDLGFIVGTGSACNSKDKTNRVLDAMGVEKQTALGNLRISFDAIEIDEIVALAEAINKVVNEYLTKVKRN